MFWLQVLLALGVVLVTVLVAGGRGDALGGLGSDQPSGRLPAGREVRPEDIHSLRLGVGLRGYRMGEVDDALDLLAAELARRDEEITRLRHPYPSLGTTGTADPGGPPGTVTPTDG